MAVDAHLDPVTGPLHWPQGDQDAVVADLRAAVGLDGLVAGRDEG